MKMLAILIHIWLAGLMTVKGSKSLGILERTALGEIVSIGNFFDARKSIMMNGASFWSIEDLQTYVKTSDSKYSNVEVDADNNIYDKIYKLGVDASLNLEVMNGLVKVDGSASYLRDEKDNDDVTRATLSYLATTKTETLPEHYLKTFPEQCEKISDTTGPTHVVSSITYGMRAHFIFDATSNNTDFEQTIKGDLKVKINKVPSFKISVNATVDIFDKEKNGIENVKIKFYGDAILSKMPSTYEDTIEMFREVNDQAGDSLTPIKYQLTPIGYYCDDLDAVLNEVRHSMVTRTTNILAELESIKDRVTTLLNRGPACRFSSIRRQLVTFEVGLKAFTSDITEKISSTIPAIKSGEKDEHDLEEEILAPYLESIWTKEKADMFLDHRTREINTIELLTEEAQNSPEVVLSDMGAATDNKCIFSHKYATVYQLYVLPETDIAQQFKDGTYQAADEADRWYNDLKRVGQAGSDLRDYLELAASNSDDQHCFIIRLDSIASNTNTVKDALVRLYKYGESVYGDELEDDFKVPKAPPAPKCTSSRYNGLVLSSYSNTDVNSLVTGIKVMATWKQLKPDDESSDESSDGVKSDEEKFDYFPTTFDVSNENNFEISGLKSNTEYEIKVAYIVDSVNSVSPYSVPLTCKTAAATAPLFKSLNTKNTGSITVEWGKPNHLNVADYRYQISLGISQLDKTECIDGEVDPEGELYRGSIAKTATGFACDIWELHHRFQEKYHKGQGLGQHNSCRNPDGEPSPWCYIETPTGSSGTWALCSIPDCSTVTHKKLVTMERHQVNQPDELSATFEELDAGQIYDVSIRLVPTNGEPGDKLEFLGATPPYPPNVPSIVSTSGYAIVLSVNLDAMKMSDSLGKDSLVVKYNKLSISSGEQLYGTEMTVTVPLSGTETSQQVILAYLDAGSKYEVKSKLRLTTPSGKLIETQYSQGIIVTANTHNNGGIDSLVEDINLYKESFSERGSQLTATITEAERLGNEATVALADCTQIETAIDGETFGESLLLATALTRKSCVKRGIKYSDYERDNGDDCLFTFAGKAHEFDCLNACKLRYNKLGAIRFTHEPSPDAGTCSCLAQRSDGIIELNGFFTSINRWCWDVMSASPAKFKSCTEENVDYTGADIMIQIIKATSSRVVSSMVDCVRLCTEQTECVSVTYSMGVGQCWLKNMESGQSKLYKQGFSSLNLSCLAADDDMQT